MHLLVATRSPGKMREIRRILADVADLVVQDLEEAGIVYDPAEEDLEPFDTFEENALSKARYFAALSGMATVADDSGIVVDALGGAPGVRSKRFALDAGVGDDDPDSVDGQRLDDANNRHLLARLAAVPLHERTARYVCVAVLVGGERDASNGSGEPLVIRGEAPGLIVAEPSGTGGFGYDPIVFDPELGKTFADMTPGEKDGRSHRGNAFRTLAEVLGVRPTHVPEAGD